MTVLSQTSAENGKSKFLSGVVLLTLSTAAVKLIGLFYKIPLIGLIGIEGMAYFLAAYHIYTLLFMISTAGLPVAVSILVSRCRAAGNEARGERIFRVSLALFSAVGLVCTAVLWLGAGKISQAIGIPQALPSIRAIAPTLLFITAGSAVRGYFQGCQIMYPTAISQIIESAGKLILGLLFTGYAQRSGFSLPVVAAYAISGLTAGAAVAMLYLLIIKALHPTRVCRCGGRDEHEVGVLGIVREIMSISAPITLGAAVISVTGVVDTALISSRLQSAGFAASVANSLYSCYGNLSIPLFNLVPSFISPVAVAMAPMIADAAARGDCARERNVLVSSFRISTLIALPASFGLAVFGRQILQLIFPGEADAVLTAAPLLTVLAPAVFFSCLITVSNAALQSYRRAALPIISMAAGAAVKIALEYLLVGIARCNIFGAPLSTVFCNLTIVVINLYYLEKHSCGTGNLTPLLLRPLSAAVIATSASALLMSALWGTGINASLVTLAVVASDALVYALLAAKLGAIDESDLALLPRGDKLVGIMKKLKLIGNEKGNGKSTKRTKGEMSARP